MNDLTHRPAPGLRRIRIVDTDPALTGLLETWLVDEGCTVVDDNTGNPAGDGACDLVIVDVPFPRQTGVDWVQRIAERHPMTPILALSSTFFTGIECCGPVARALGVACVLAKPASRDTLVCAVLRLLPP